MQKERRGIETADMMSSFIEWLTANVIKSEHDRVWYVFQHGTLVEAFEYYKNAEDEEDEHEMEEVEEEA